MSSDAIPELAARVVAGEPRAIARAISLVEDGGPDGRALIGRLYPKTGRAYVIGVTGAPGTGKSTLVDQLIAEIRRDGTTVGVLAVDPSSPFTGGAVLGDRVRMGSHAADRGVYIRSLATRGHLGGLSGATEDAALVLDAAGMDIVIIETVGVGQDEVDIVAAADVTIVVLVPGAGDDLQAMKAGVMEIGDLFVVNKADREGADRVVQAIGASLALKPAEPGEWTPPILKTEATTGAGVDALWSEIGRFRERSVEHRSARRGERRRSRLRTALARAFLRHADRVVPAADLEQLAGSDAAAPPDPYSAADALLARVLAMGPNGKTSS